MFPMGERSAVKANVKENRVEKKAKTNPKLEELYAKCYEELMEALHVMAEQFKLKTSSIMTIEVSSS